METKYAITRNALRITAFLAAAALAIMLALIAQPAHALTDESSSTSSSVEGTPVGGLPLMGNDYVWFGNELNMKKATVENDVIAAGRTIKLTDCSVLGDMRIAAQNIDIADSSAAENITVAAETINLSNSQARTLAAAGKTFSFGGSCDSLIVYANDVFINGTVDGDVIVGANNVTIGTDARIVGTLRVSAPSDPVMQRGAEVGDVEYTKSEGSVSTAEAGEQLASVAASFAILAAVLGAIGTLLIALFSEWLFKRHTAAAAEMIRTRTGATIGSGVVGAIAAPIVIIILCCLVITLPIAGILTLALIAMTMAAGGFAGASLFKLAFPKMNRFVCALIGGVIVGVASAIPFLGSLVGAAAFMYFLGYVLQSIFLTLSDKGDMPTPPNGAPAPVAPAPEFAPAPAPEPFSTSNTVQ